MTRNSSTMNHIGKSLLLFSVVLILSSLSVYSQKLSNLLISDSQGLITENLVLSDSTKIILSAGKPLYSFLLNEKLFNSGEAEAIKTGDQYLQLFENILRVTFMKTVHSGIGWKGEITFENTGADTISISNVVPFGEDNNSVNITGRGPSDLAYFVRDIDRSGLFFLIMPGNSGILPLLPERNFLPVLLHAGLKLKADRGKGMKHYYRRMQKLFILFMQMYLKVNGKMDFA
jgi:hypothetical protein